MTVKQIELAKMTRREIEASDLLSLMPWYWCAAHWIVTVILSVPLTVVILVCIAVASLGDAGYRWADRASDRAVTVVHNIRWWILHRVYEKYSLFLILKDT